MIVQIQKEQLIEGLQKAANIIPTRSGAAYLRSLWIRAENESISLMATDTNIEFIGTYVANVQQDGMIGVNGRNFVELLRRLSAGTVSLRLDNESSTLIVEQGRRTYKLPVNDRTWFQELAPFPETTPITWSGDVLKESLDKSLFCVSDDETSDALSCLYICTVQAEDGNIDICGLNGHQFARIRLTHNELASTLPEEGVLLQKKYVTELRKWLNDDEIEINLTEKRLFIRTMNGQECVSLPRAALVYPEYQAFLDKLNDPEAAELHIHRKECLEALDRISIFNTENDRCTFFDLSSHELQLSAQGQDTGSANESLEVQYAGSIERVVFPTKNMMDILTKYHSEQLKLVLTGTEGPCGIYGQDDPGYVVLLMPMKIAQQQYYSEE